VSGLALVVAVFALAWTGLRRSVEERRQVGSAGPRPTASPAPAAPSRALEPSLLIAQAKSLALAWHQDALLVEIEAGPVENDGSIGDSGSVRFRFGKPSTASVGNGAQVSPGQFQVVFDGSGSQTAELNAAQARAVAEPNCLVEDVAKVVGSATRAADPLRLRYGLSEKLGRPVWRVYGTSSPASVYTLDGVSCNVLAER
jgi:hypothetical protein